MKKILFGILLLQGMALVIFSTLSFGILAAIVLLIPYYIAFAIAISLKQIREIKIASIYYLIVNSVMLVFVYKILFTRGGDLASVGLLYLTVIHLFLVLAVLPFFRIKKK